MYYKTILSYKFSLHIGLKEPYNVQNNVKTAFRYFSLNLHHPRIYNVRNYFEPTIIYVLFIDWFWLLTEIVIYLLFYVKRRKHIFFGMFWSLGITFTTLNLKSYFSKIGKSRKTIQMLINRNNVQYFDNNNKIRLEVERFLGNNMHKCTFCNAIKVKTCSKHDFKIQNRGRQNEII